MNRLVSLAAGCLLAATALSGCGSSSGSSTSPSAAAPATSSATTSSAASSPAPTTETATSSGPTSYTMADVAKHASPTSCWAAIDKNVYDLTAWINKHPGGPDKIKALCGTNATSAFTKEHGNDAEPKERLATFKIGALAG